MRNWLKKWRRKTDGSRKAAARALRRLDNGHARPIVRWSLDPSLSLKELQSRLSGILEEYGVAAVVTAAHAAIGALRESGCLPRPCRNLYTAAMRALSFHDIEQAIEFGERYLDEFHDLRAIHSLVIFYLRTDEVERPLELLAHLKVDEWHAEMSRALNERIYKQKLEGEYREELVKLLPRDDEEVRMFISQLLDNTEHKLHTCRFIYEILFSDLQRHKRHYKLVIEYGEALLELVGKDTLAALQICNTYLYSKGDFSRSRQVLMAHTEDVSSKKVNFKLEVLDGLKQLLEKGFRYEVGEPVVDYQPTPSRILYVLHNSLPHITGGYAVRAHGLLSGIQQSDWDISGVTRLGYPKDLKGFKDDSCEPLSVIDDVYYHRLQEPDIRYGKIPLHDYLCEYTESLYRFALRERPEIIHAASNFMNGLAANAVARALGIKSVYEVRGLWEITRISRQPEWEHSDYFEMMRRMETQAANEADAVICITKALKAEMIRRGVDADKITVVSNGVNPDRFMPQPKNRALEADLDLENKTVIGYVGSIVQYEGLDDLLRAVALLKERGVRNFAVLIVGDGAVWEDIKTLSSKLGLDGLVTFTGRVPHEAVADYYSLIDLAPFPRKSLPVTEMVSPLKPFEAMAMQKIVVASDVAALEEIIVEGVNGFLFRKDVVQDLADKLERLLEKRGIGPQFNPRQWVLENRDWKDLCGRLDELYRGLTEWKPGGKPVRSVDLAKVEYTPEISKIFNIYKTKYKKTNPNFIRRDDYFRWSYIISLIESGDSLLDVGISIGQFINALAAMGTFTKLHGVDIRPHSLFLRTSDDYTMDYVSIDALPYAENEFDVVTCLETLEHLDDDVMVRGLAQLRRVCRKQLIITVPFREEPLGREHLRKFDVDSLKTIFPHGEITLLKKSTKLRDGSNVYWCLIEETLA